MGRYELDAPNNRDYHILEALRAGHSGAEVGRVYGISRERVRQIKKRWPEYAPSVKPILKVKMTRNGGRVSHLNVTETYDSEV